MNRPMVFIVVCLLLAGGASAEVQLSKLFTDHMVLQRGMAVPIWGTAKPGEAVTISIGDKKLGDTKADDKGVWRIDLPAMQTGEPFELAVAGENTIKLIDVVVGEVWVCSGQSNMEFSLDRATGATEAIAGADKPDIRLMNAGWNLRAEPSREIHGGPWARCSPQTVPKFSAVAYFFAVALQQDVKVPIGLVQAASGWTPAETWMSREALSADPQIKHDILDEWDGWVADYPAKHKAWEAKKKEWDDQAAKLKAEGKPEPDPKTAPPEPGNPDFIHRATAHFNGAVSPLVPMAMRGVIWYQGETNDSRAYQYRKLFPMLIRDWRKAWGRDFPFLWVQLSTVGELQKDPTDSEWAELREAQAMALSEPKTGMAVSFDVGDGDVHPPNKKPMGERLALVARAVAYDEKVESIGPTYKSMAVDGDKIKLTFDHAAGLKPGKGDTLEGFTIAGEDKKFHNAQAAIDGETVVVSSPDVPKPIAPRYAWATHPLGNLVNAAGLPASPFRTDDWKGVTVNNTTMWFESVVGK